MRHIWSKASHSQLRHKCFACWFCLSERTVTSFPWASAQSMWSAFTMSWQDFWSWQRKVGLHKCGWHVWMASRVFAADRIEIWIVLGDAIDPIKHLSNNNLTFFSVHFYPESFWWFSFVTLVHCRKTGVTKPRAMVRAMQMLYLGDSTSEVRGVHLAWQNTALWSCLDSSIDEVLEET